jgi:hypothetical protein
MTVRARAVAWWRRNHADPERRAFRRIGIISFGVVGLSVVLAKLVQDTPVAGVVRALAITMFGLAAIALLGVAIVMGEDVVDEMDATDPMRARHGGAYGPRIKQSLRDARRGTREWIVSLPHKIASLPGKLADLRHDLTRESFSRLATASAHALGGIPPADVGPPRGAGRLARPIATPPAPEPEQGPAPPESQEVPTDSPPLRKRRALTASELADRPRAGASRPPGNVRSSRALRPTRRSGRGAPRTGRTLNTGVRSQP